MKSWANVYCWHEHDHIKGPNVSDPWNATAWARPRAAAHMVLAFCLFVCHFLFPHCFSLINAKLWRTKIKSWLHIWYGGIQSTFNGLQRCLIFIIISAKNVTLYKYIEQMAEMCPKPFQTLLGFLFYSQAKINWIRFFLMKWNLSLKLNQELKN